MQDAAARVADARTALFLDEPFFGFLSLRLKVIQDTDGAKTKTMGTDGTNLVYFPDWVQKQSNRVLKTVLAHEAMHCGLRHMYRVNGRSWPKWNVATDHAVNLQLVDAGFELWDGAACDPQFKDMSSEQIYALLPDEPEGDEPGGEPGEGDQPGGVLPPPPDATDADGDPTLTDGDWQVIAEQASMVSRKAGTMPGGVDRAIKESRKPTANWRELLRQFIEHQVPSDYSWSPPNRRYVAMGLYLPGVYRENCPMIGIGIDTSGSITDDMLAHFSAEVTAILREVRPEALEVAFADDGVRSTLRISPDDPDVELHSPGGGGTAFQPTFDYFSGMDYPPAAVIYFTDLLGDNPQPPAYPVLWLVPERSSVEAPFGTRATFSMFE